MCVVCLDALRIWTGVLRISSVPESLRSIKVVDPSIIYVKDATGTTLVELDVELTVD